METLIFPLNSNEAVDVNEIICPVCKDKMDIHQTEYEESNAPDDDRAYPAILTPINETAGYTYITKCRRCQSELKIPTSNHYRYY